MNHLTITPRSLVGTDYETPAELLGRARALGLPFGVYDDQLWVQLDSARPGLLPLAAALLERAAEVVPLLRPAEPVPLSPTDVSLDPEAVFSPPEFALLKMLKALRAAPLSAPDRV